MKRSVTIWILSLAVAFFFSGGVLAQDEVEVSVKVKKDGKVIQDTTYHFDDAAAAKNAIKMMEVLSGEAKTMAFISEDGKHTEITELSGDSAIWVTGEEADGEHVKVLKYRIKEGQEPGGEHVIVMRSEDGETFDILVDEDFKDDDVSWTVREGDEIDRDENVYIIREDDDLKGEMVKIIEESDGEEGTKMKVIIIKED